MHSRTWPIVTDAQFSTYIFEVSSFSLFGSRKNGKHKRRRRFLLQSTVKPQRWAAVNKSFIALPFEKFQFSFALNVCASLLQIMRTTTFWNVALQTETASSSFHVSAFLISIFGWSLLHSFWVETCLSRVHGLNVSNTAQSHSFFRLKLFSFIAISHPWGVVDDVIRTRLNVSRFTYLSLWTMSSTRSIFSTPMQHWKISTEM